MNANKENKERRSEMITRADVEEAAQQIREAIARKEALPMNHPKRAERLATDRKMLAAAEGLARRMMPSGSVGYSGLSGDELEFITIWFQC